MSRRIVKNYPSPRLMETIGATNQKPAEAIGELVANCFDARVDDNKINIIVDMRKNEIAVIDNGKGMTSQILEKAVCIAEDMSKHLERGEDAKGHFGMGFKTSCSTLGRYYEIFTKPLGGKTEFHVGFDINDYSNRPSGADAWDITIEEESSFPESPIENLQHGTAFVIKKLRDPNIFVSSVLDYLGEAFKGHLETGDTIDVIKEDGETLHAVPKVYNFIPGTKIDIDEAFGPNDKYRITGWMALDSQTHNDGLYGFNIYRKNQLVEKWDKSWFKPHLMTSRIIGEVNMDFLEATFYKQGTQQSESWLISKRHMEEYLAPIVSASRDVSRQKNINNPSELKRIVSKLNNDYGNEELGTDQDEAEAGKKVENSKGAKDLPLSKKIGAIVKESSLILQDRGEIEITYLEKESNGSIKSPFDYIFQEALDPDEENAELQVLLFNNHPLWVKKIDPEVQKILAISDSIYRVLVEKMHFDTSDALKIRNEWVKKRVCK